MKEQFIQKWSNWWMLQKQGGKLTEAFEKELNAIIEQEAVKLFRQRAVMPSLPNGKKVLAALKEFSDSLTDEEKEQMFGNEA